MSKETYVVFETVTCRGGATIDKFSVTNDPEEARQQYERSINCDSTRCAGVGLIITSTDWGPTDSSNIIGEVLFGNLTATGRMKGSNKLKFQNTPPRITRSRQRGTFTGAQNQPRDTGDNNA